MIDVELDWDRLLQSQIEILKKDFKEVCPDNYMECVKIAVSYLILEEEHDNPKSITYWQEVLDKINKDEIIQG